MPKKAPLIKTDGLGPAELKAIRSALRLVWSRSHARKLAIKRATAVDGFARCEQCQDMTPKVFVDHITRVGEIDHGFITRLFVPSVMLQCLCSKCHNKKTSTERRYK